MYSVKLFSMYVVPITSQSQSFVHEPPHADARLKTITNSAESQNLYMDSIEM